MKTAYFAGGCFWCITPTFKEMDGVLNVISGYSGGDEADPAYNNGNAAYYLAQAYNRGGDLESAIPYYQYIVDNYPNTEKAATARNYINAN